MTGNIYKIFWYRKQVKNNPTKHFFDNDICDSDPFCNEKRKGREDVCSHMSMSCLRCDSNVGLFIFCIITFASSFQLSFALYLWSYGNSSRRRQHLSIEDNRTRDVTIWFEINSVLLSFLFQTNVINWKIYIWLCNFFWL